MAALKGYRTIVFNVIMLGFMIATQQGWIGSEDAPTGEQVSGWLDHLDAVLTGLWAVGNIALRFATNTPVGKAA